MTRKKAIVKTATRLFAEKGFRETTVAEIAAATGVAEGTLFYHFKSKEELLLHILQRIKEQVLEESRAYRQKNRQPDGFHLVEDVVCFYLYITTQMEESFSLLQHSYIYQLARTNPTCRGHLQEIYNGLIDIFEQAIVSEQANGTIGSLSARKTAILIFTMVDGLVRFRSYDLYDAAALHADLIAACRRMLTMRKKE